MMNWDKAQATIEAMLADWGHGAQAVTPGGAVIGFDKDAFRFTACGGLADLSSRTPFTEETVVRYASVTKHAFCTLVLSHPDRIRLDDRLGEHLPELREPLASVSVGRALDMSGGLPDVREMLSLLGFSVYSETRKDALLDFLSRQTRLNFAAGTEVSYSNTGYRLVEAALERQGIYFRDYIRSAGQEAGAIFDAPDVWNDVVAGLVPGYWHDDAKWQLAAAGLHISASGSMTGSVRSLALWLQALLKGDGRLAGRLQEMSGPRLLADGRESGYGLGLAQTKFGDKVFIGHGGSHPGYKTYFLLDPETGVGFAVVSNREDTNGAKIAQAAMVALLDLPLPRLSRALRDGLYVEDSGPNWIEVKGASIISLDAEDTAYDDGEGWVSSRSSTSPIRLRMEGDDIVGDVGHAPRRYRPARDEGVPEDLSGSWQSHEGARFDIHDGQLIMGIGPTRPAMPLHSLGGGRFLFTLRDGPWTKRICLNRLDDGRVELVLARARMIEYHRAR
ncbi:serine hydrolase domain-containing protein [Allorhizobium taibaishanense]|uniref:CubicO group peptidase (Beta-lactamase class C family) n=1 Tax=Allorhizobium taibaishanense TaxID=887144 RepID=A0A1Q9A5U4_9HYPH|nr:CubicO group peptidase (beta-lactamase class C family) [Allorhizobium taibaishanense]OLP49971.1 serine hydrolase [Allorhizobium taibaishanense]